MRIYKFSLKTHQKNKAEDQTRESYFYNFHNKDMQFKMISIWKKSEFSKTSIIPNQFSQINKSKKQKKKKKTQRDNLELMINLCVRISHIVPMSIETKRREKGHKEHLSLLRIQDPDSLPLITTTIHQGSHHPVLNTVLLLDPRPHRPLRKPHYIPRPVPLEHPKIEAAGEVIHKHLERRRPEAGCNEARGESGGVGEGGRDGEAEIRVGDEDWDADPEKKENYESD